MDTGFWARLRERKLVQWGVAYLAGAWLLLQVISLLGATYAWPDALLQAVPLLLAVGFLAALIAAWYHGENGEQRVSAVELVMMSALLVLAGSAVAWVGRDSLAEPAPPVPAGSEGVSAPAPAAVQGSVAVLPFVNMSSDPEQEYFSDGLSEELLNVLAELPELRVASRTSTFAFKGKDVGIDSIARALKVAHVLEGSVRKSGERIRITAQLIEAESGYHLWSETYDRDLKDVFAVQDEISRAIVGALQVRLSGAGAVRPLVEERTDDPEAYQLYLRGRYLWNRRTEAGLTEAVELFKRATQRAPGYAQAHLGLADAYAVAGFWNYLPPWEAFPAAKKAARRALALDPSLSSAHATLGYAALYHDWDWAAAEAEFLRAIQLSPRYPVAHQWYGNFLVARGRFADANRALLRARELDPLSLIAGAAHGWALYHAGDHERAIVELRGVLELDPGYALAHLWLGKSYEELKRREEARAAYRRAIALAGDANAVAALARLHALAGERREALALLRELESRGRYAPPYEIAKVHLALGDEDRAFEWLQRAYRERSHSLVFLGVDPQLRPLRSDPRFALLAAKVGI